MPRRKKKRILIVDADAFLAGIYARRFESGSWGVRVAETVDEARKIIADLEPNAVLIDIETIPGGMAFLRELRSDDKVDPVLVVLTKLGDRNAIEEAMAAGADSYVLKGHFVPSEVRVKIERLVS